MGPLSACSTATDVYGAFIRDFLVDYFGSNDALDPDGPRNRRRKVGAPTVSGHCQLAIDIGTFDNRTDARVRRRLFVILNP